MYDLVKRLRDRRVCSLAHNSCRNDFACEEAADRIEALEAENARMREALEFYAADCEATDKQPCGYGGSLCCMTARSALLAARRTPAPEGDERDDR